MKYGLALGIDPDPDNPLGVHPTSSATESYTRGDASAWLSSQIEDDSDEIGNPPMALREYLTDHQDDLRALEAALQKDAPEWSEPADGEHLGTQFLLTMRVSRVLLAAALIEDLDGNSIESGQALEASWSLWCQWRGGRSSWSNSSLLRSKDCSPAFCERSSSHRSRGRAG